MNSLTRQVLSIPCPHCQAAAGEQCRLPGSLRRTTLPCCRERWLASSTTVDSRRTKRERERWKRMSAEERERKTATARRQRRERNFGRIN